MSGSRSSNITWHGDLLDPGARERLLGQAGCVVWLTGLAGSGKSTLARAAERELGGAGRLA